MSAQNTTKAKPKASVTPTGSDLALLDKLKHLRGCDTRELAMMAGMVVRSDEPTVEALIMMMNNTILELRHEILRLKPMPNMRRMK